MRYAGAMLYRAAKHQGCKKEAEGGGRAIFSRTPSQHCLVIALSNCMGQSVPLVATCMLCPTALLHGSIRACLWSAAEPAEGDRGRSSQCWQPLPTYPRHRQLLQAGSRAVPADGRPIRAAVYLLSVFTALHSPCRLLPTCCMCPRRCRCMSPPRALPAPLCRLLPTCCVVYCAACSHLRRCLSRCAGWAPATALRRPRAAAQLAPPAGAAARHAPQRGVHRRGPLCCRVGPQL